MVWTSEITTDGLWPPKVQPQPYRLKHTLHVTANEWTSHGIFMLVLPDCHLPKKNQ